MEDGQREVFGGGSTDGVEAFGGIVGAGAALMTKRRDELNNAADGDGPGVIAYLVLRA
jgi:hypothetical protein